MLGVLPLHRLDLVAAGLGRLCPRASPGDTEDALQPSQGHASGPRLCQAPAFAETGPPPLPSAKQTGFLAACITFWVLAHFRSPEALLAS